MRNRFEALDFSKNIFDNFSNSKPCTTTEWSSMQIQDIIDRADGVKKAVLESGVSEEDFNEMLEFLSQAIAKR